MKDCMKILLKEESCNPNIEDNYGETLINYAIKHKKQQSLRYILESGNADIEQAN